MSDYMFMLENHLNAAQSRVVNELQTASAEVNLNLFLTGGAVRDIVLRQPDSWHQPGVALTEPTAEQAGVAVAYDIKSKAYKTIYSMGRSNHENELGVPGYGHPVVLTGDDTFDAPASQLYMLSAASGSAFWNDQGTLYAFVSDNPAINDYGDARRVVRRATVRGEVPVSVDGRSSEVVKGEGTTLQ